MNDLNTYRPSPSWFAHNPYGIHGIGHAARVLIWANLVGEQLRASGGALSIEAVRWAAVLHDVARLSDGWDRGHGARSADWVLENRDNLPFILPNELFEQVLLCCRWHEITDEDIPTMTPELICIKDADGLDRVRINDLNPDYLRSEAARLLVSQAWSLYHATELADDPWEAVLKAASWSSCRLSAEPV
jgi:hypothetical protein